MSSFPRWTDAEIEQGCREALRAYIVEWGANTTVEYLSLYNQKHVIVQRLLDKTDKLRRLDIEVFAADWPLLAALRYCWSPPVSEDVLANLVGKKFGDKRPRRSRENDEFLRIAVDDVLLPGVDTTRFPWVGAGRNPTHEEASTAVVSTAVLMAVERIRTNRRLDPARRQQEAVAAVLRDECGYRQVPRPKEGLKFLDDMARGTFTEETSLRGEKADVPVRLLDGRLLAIECKVTNDRTNSVKRIKHDTGKKAAKWRRDLGEEQVVVGAVVSGVVAPETIKAAQNEDKVFVVWQHDLSRLRDFVRSAR